MSPGSSSNGRRPLLPLARLCLLRDTTLLFSPVTLCFVPSVNSNPSTPFKLLSLRPLGYLVSPYQRRPRGATPDTTLKRRRRPPSAPHLSQSKPVPPRTGPSFPPLSTPATYHAYTFPYRCSTRGLLRTRSPISLRSGDPVTSSSPRLRMSGVLPS